MELSIQQRSAPLTPRAQTTHTRRHSNPRRHSNLRAQQNPSSTEIFGQRPSLKNLLLLAFTFFLTACAPTKPSTLPQQADKLTATHTPKSTPQRTSTATISGVEITNNPTFNFLSSHLTLNKGQWGTKPTEQLDSRRFGTTLQQVHQLTATASDSSVSEITLTLPSNYEPLPLIVDKIEYHLDGGQASTNDSLSTLNLDISQLGNMDRSSPFSKRPIEIIVKNSQLIAIEGAEMNDFIETDEPTDGAQRVNTLVYRHLKYPLIIKTIPNDDGEFPTIIMSGT